MPDIKTLAAARNVDLVDTFTKSLNKLSMMLSACEPIKAAAGETLHHKKITGKLSTEEYTEGQAIPVSNYTWEDIKTYEVGIKPYRKQTTLQEIKKRGYDMLASIYFLPFRPTYFHQSRRHCFADRANADAPLPASPCPPSRRRRRATRLSGGRTARLSL